MSNHHPLKRSLAAVFVVGAAALPAAAQALPIESGTGGGALTSPVAVPSAPQPGPTAQAGFQWGDAGIGAAGATLLVSAGALSAGMTRRRRARRLVIG
jgi:hypothetical protein